MASKNLLLFLLIIITFLPALAATDRDEQFYKEINFITGYSKNYDWLGKKGKTLRNAMGFEYFRTFSDQYGDYLKLNLQMRISYDSIAQSSDRFSVDVHNAWGEYKLALGEYLRFGHFDPAFGLEPDLDTHGTLLQTLAMKNIGYKKDWGLAYNGLLGDFDFEFAAQTGSGMPLHRKDNSLLMTTRISTPKRNPVVWGLSLLYGRTLKAEKARTLPATDFINDSALKKRKIGLDLQMPIGLFDFKGEVAVGNTEDKTDGGAMAQIEYTPPEIQDIKFKLQTIWWQNEWSDKQRTDLTISPIIQWQLNTEWTLRIGYFHDIMADETRNEDRAVYLQLYFFGI